MNVDVKTSVEHAASEIRAVLPEGLEPIEKTAFSSCGAQEFVSRLEGAGARQVLLCGVEAHVCVNQTAHDLLARGYQVHNRWLQFRSKQDVKEYEKEDLKEAY